MAYIRRFRDVWQAQVQRDGKRQSKTFPTREQAEEWAAAAEKIIKLRKDNVPPPPPQVRDFSDPRLISALPSRVLDALTKVPFDRATVLQASLPCGSMCGVYFLIDKDEVVYVGQSLDVLNRLSKHMRGGRRFERFAFIACKKEDLDELERLYINALVPAWNTAMPVKKARAVSPVDPT